MRIDDIGKIITYVILPIVYINLFFVSLISAVEEKLFRI